MLAEPVRYTSADEDSSRWDGFEFRPGDIVISTRPKTGTTWLQMICALLIFQTPDLPAPLARLSPWLDWLITPLGQVRADLAAQRHRRFIKTHTPLDGLPLNTAATYIVAGRHPLDAAVSVYHQSENIDAGRVAELTGGAAPATGPAMELRDWLRAWIGSRVSPRERLYSLPGLMWHVTDAWARQADPGLHGPTVLLVHYDDLRADLAGEMRKLAGLLGIAVPERAWPGLVSAATFGQMRARAAVQAPDPEGGVLRDPAAFFRRGSSGAGEEALAASELARYYDRAADLAPPDVLRWLHRGRGSLGCRDRGSTGAFLAGWTRWNRGKGQVD